MSLVDKNSTLKPCDVRQFPNPYQGPGGRNPLDNGGGPPHDGDMENRLTILETRFDAVLPTLATKGDIAEVRADIARQTLATVLTLIGVLLAALFGINQMNKSAAPQQAAAPQPIIITVPQAPSAPAAPATK